MTDANDVEQISPLTYCEAAYLDANADIADAVRGGGFKSGRMHYMMFGKNESHRRQTRSIAELEKGNRKEKIRNLLGDAPYREDGHIFDFLTDELRSQFNIIDTKNVSSNGYDGDVLALIEKHRHGLVLDCGAGSRPTIYENVINFEVAAYPSTDVRGVGEVLPFKDGSFDAVISSAVLEHVKDPFKCAQEIIRILKPGGDLMCCVPFLQPMHGYPHHYYNMSEQGIRNLFDPHVSIHRHEVPDSVLPIWSLSWMLNSWADGLDGDALFEFRSMTVADLMAAPATFLDRKFVRTLSKEKNMELASATVIHATKR
jgi:SAM-dependent methyltransferase